LRILLLRTSSIGDVLMTTPAFDALRRSFPAAHIAWMIDQESREILDGVEGVDEVLVNPLPNGRHFKFRRDFRRTPQLWREARRFRHELLARKFDVAIDLQGLFRTAIWCKLSGAPMRIGLSDNKKEMNERFVTHRVDPLGPHTVERLAAPAKFLGADVSDLKFRYRVPEAGREYADSFFTQYAIRNTEKVIAVNPGASWRINRWPPDKLGEAANLLRQKLAARILLIGGRDDMDLADEVASHLDSPPLNVTGRTTLTQLAGLLERCAVLITGDTGPMHLATAVGTPVVALFGPSDARVSGPYSKNSVVIETALPCRPCWRKPVACEGRIDCMTALTPEQVAQACDGVMRKSNGHREPSTSMGWLDDKSTILTDS